MFRMKRIIREDASRNLREWGEERLLLRVPMV
jgi:hypothetical protein